MTNQRLDYLRNVERRASAFGQAATVAAIAAHADKLARLERRNGGRP